MTEQDKEAPPAAPPSPEDSVYFFDGISWTPQIDDAAQAVALWINCDMCGASLWGLPRVGKSEFTKYFERVANEMFRGTVVVIRLWFGGEQFTKSDQFLRRSLSNVGVRAASTRQLESLRIRLMDEIWSRCTPATRRIVVIGDELQNVASALYGEFAIMETTISERGYIPFLLCIGQPELRSTIANLEKNLHIMGRQFQELREFCGLSFDQIEKFLRILDGEDKSFSKKHFPTRATQGWSIVQLIKPLEEAVHSMCSLDTLNLELFFPMAYLRQTLNYVFFFLSEETNTGDEAIIEAILEAFDRNGFKKVVMAYSKQKEDPKNAPEVAQ